MPKSNRKKNIQPHACVLTTRGKVQTTSSLVRFTRAIYAFPASSFDKEHQNIKIHTNKQISNVNSRRYTRGFLKLGSRSPQKVIHLHSGKSVIIEQVFEEQCGNNALLIEHRCSSRMMRKRNCDSGIMECLSCVGCYERVSVCVCSDTSRSPSLSLRDCANVCVCV
jgi:hypothetical protein